MGLFMRPVVKVRAVWYNNSVNERSVTRLLQESVVRRVLEEAL